MLCNNYPLQAGHSWLTDSLAEEFARDNYVEVVFLDWHGQHKEYLFVERNSVKIHVLPMSFSGFKGKIGKVLKWLFASYMHFFSIRRCLTQSKYDLVVNFSPAMVMHPIFKSVKARVKSSYLILWDFFPIYHSQLGLIPSLGGGVLKGIETRACNDYQRIGLMSPRNLDFFLENYDIKPTTLAEVLYLWGPNEFFVRDHAAYSAVRKKEGVGDQLVCVFGGQLIKGRGVDKLIELAIYSRENNIDALFYIFGDGPEREAILGDLERFGLSDVVIYKGFKPREEYMEFLKGADLGLVFNSGHVTVPTFPSKAIDYFRAAVPVLAYVEDATDFGDILEKEIKAGWSASPKFHTKLFSNFEEAYALPRTELFNFGRAGQNWYADHLKVSEVVRHLTGGQS